MCVYGTFLHELYEKKSQYRNVSKRILNTTVEAYTHQISSQSEHSKRIHAEKNISPSEPRNQITYQGGAFAYIDYFHTIRGEMYRALTKQTQYFCLHLWKLDKEKTALFTSLKGFAVFDPTKVCWKQQKRNKQALSFILHQKSSKSIY